MKIMDRSKSINSEKDKVDQLSKSVLGRYWQARNYNDDYIYQLKNELHISDILAKIISVRVEDKFAAQDYLDPKIKSLMPDPFHLKDMDKAASRMVMAIMGKEQICIFADYDVDGATSSALIKTIPPPRLWPIREVLGPISGKCSQPLLRWVSKRSKSSSSLLKLFSAKASRSGKSMGCSTVPPLCEKLNFTKQKPASANAWATKCQGPQSLNPLYP